MDKTVYYSSIDELPIYNWWKINETKDYSFLVKSGNVDGLELEVWEKLYREFLTVFGINEGFQQYLELLKELEILKLDMLITGDRSIETFIDIKEHELKELTTVKEKGKLDDVRTHVSKFMGFRIDEKIVSVKEYYGYLYALEKEVKQSQKNHVG